MLDSPVVEPVSQQSVNTPLASPPQPKTNWWKLATILLILLLGGSGVYLITPRKTPSPTPTPPTLSQASPTTPPSSDPTANWKTYASREYTYSFRVPTSWTTTEENGQFESKLSTSGKISILTTKGEGGTISIFFEGEFDHGLEPWKVEATENITIGQTPATKNTFSLTGNPNKWVIITIDSLHNFRIEIQGSKGFMETADQILSTFRFLDNNTQGRWKMYDAGSFTLNIPSSWQVSNNTGTYDFYSGLPGRVELIIGKTDKTVVQSKREIEGYFASTPQKRELTLGKATAVEYYGCAGVEGCMDQYILVISHGNQIYNLHFTLYPDQESELYSNIISSLKFK